MDSVPPDYPDGNPYDISYAEMIRIAQRRAEASWYEKPRNPFNPETVAPGKLRKRTIKNGRLAKKIKIECNRRDIGTHARIIMNGRAKVCAHCGYSRFVEVCHIRAVKDFPITATVAEINDPANLMYLCRNCHWEFDHKSN